MRYSELTRQLRRLGVVRDEQERRHEVWFNSANGRRTRIPRHATQEIPAGTLHRILTDLGLTREDLVQR